MTVIINELEVIAEQEPPPTGPPASPTRPRPVGLSPYELRAALHHLADRAERVRAD
jgi:hypothetical protein